MALSYYRVLTFSCSLPGPKKVFPTVEKFNSIKSHYSGQLFTTKHLLFDIESSSVVCRNILRRFLIYLPRTIDTISFPDVCRDERRKVSEQIRVPLFHREFIIYSFCRGRAAAFLSNVNFSIRVVKDFHDRMIDGRCVCEGNKKQQNSLFTLFQSTYIDIVFSSNYNIYDPWSHDMDSTT